MAIGFSDQFEHFLLPDEDSIRVAMTSGLLVFDANVLLSAYRFAQPARLELFDTIEQIGDRVWIPHQAALEFFRNRRGVISEQVAAYTEVADMLGEFERKFRDKVYNMANRTNLKNEERDKIVAPTEEMLGKAQRSVEILRDAHGLVEPTGTDEVLIKFQGIFHGKTGLPFESEVQDTSLKEALRRVDMKIPPGYMDAKKENPEGDYFVWKQTLDEAASRDIKWLVFVTGDRKEDWHLQEKGKIICARPELVLEAMKVAGVRLIVMEIRSFLHHANRYLDSSISTDTLRQAEQIADSSELLRLAQVARTRLHEAEIAATAARASFLAAAERTTDCAAEIRELEHRVSEAERRSSTLESEDNGILKMLHGRLQERQEMRRRLAVERDRCQTHEMICITQVDKLRAEDEEAFKALDASFQAQRDFP